MLTQEYNPSTLHRQTINSFRLRNRITALDIWSARQAIRIQYVSGLIATRTNPRSGQWEVLLVNGTSNGKPKPFWQFPGGRVEKNEDPIAALYDELHEELGVELPFALTYLKTYVPKPKANDKEVLAIHAFQLPGDCDWDRGKGNIELGSDVDQMIWSSDPLRDIDGQPRVLTTQTDYMLRNYLGFAGPKNKNTENDLLYHGEPDVRAFAPVGLKL